MQGESIKNIVKTTVERLCGENTKKHLFDKIGQGNVEELLRFCAQLAPFRKIVVIYTQSCFEKVGKQFAEGLNKMGLKVISLVLCNTELTVSNLSGLFCLAEDVRLAVGVGSEAWAFADYFAMLREIPSVSVVCDSPQGVFRRDLTIKNSNRITIVRTDGEKNVFFLNGFECNVLELFEKLSGKILYLSDYRIYKALKGERVAESVYEMYIAELIEGLKLLKIHQEQRAEYLTDRLIVIETLENFCGFNCANVGLDTAGRALNGWKRLRVAEIFDYLEWASAYSSVAGVDKIQVMCGIAELLKISRGVRKKLFSIVRAELDRMNDFIGKAKAVRAELAGRQKYGATKREEWVAYANYPFGLNTANLIKI